MQMNNLSYSVYLGRKFKVSLAYRGSWVRHIDKPWLKVSLYNLLVLHFRECEESDATHCRALAYIHEALLLSPTTGKM